MESDSTYPALTAPAPPRIGVFATLGLVILHLFAAPLLALAVLGIPLALLGLAGDGESLGTVGPLTGAASLLGNLITVGAIALWLRGRNWLKDALGLRPGTVNWWTAAGLTLVLIITADLLTVLLGRSVVPPQLAPLFATPANAFVWGLAVVAGAPLAEELVYRGVVYGAVLRRWGISAAYLITVVVFAFVHVMTYGLDWYSLAQVLVLSVFLTGIRAVSRSLIPCIISHVVANLYATLVAVYLLQVRVQ